MTIKRIAPYTLGLAAACLLASCDVGPQPVAEETAPLVADAELDRCQQITAEQLQTCLARYPAAAADTCRVFNRDGLEACQISRCRRERETVFSRCLDEARSGRGPGAGAQGILACGQLAQSACTDPARLCFPPPPRPPGASNPPPPPPTPTTPPRPPTPPIPVPPPPPPPRG